MYVFYNSAIKIVTINVGIPADVSFALHNRKDRDCAAFRLCSLYFKNHLTEWASLY